MSYILDALKKLEHEKTRTSRASGKINITGELYGGGQIRPTQGRPIKTVLLVLVVVLLTVGVTWFFMKDNGVQSRSAAKSGEIHPASVATNTIPKPVTSVPPAPVAQIHAVQPSVAPVAASAPPVVKQPAPLAAVQSATPDENEEKTYRDYRKQSKKAAILPLPESTALKPGPAPADIKVSGIAWQEEHRDRRAVVNGFLMREGAVVAGAKITEILQDRVRFSLSGSSFEVTFISAEAPVTGK
jgi:general secretion pathway protein B